MDNNMGPAPDSGTLEGLLGLKAFEIASCLDLPLGHAGKPFILPKGPYLLCEVTRQQAKSASLGANGALRIDGALKITVGALISDQANEAGKIAEQVAAQIPRGSGLDYEGELGKGEIVFKIPEILEPRHDAGRVNIDVVLGFYAILFKE